MPPPPPHAPSEPDITIVEASSSPSTWMIFVATEQDLGPQLHAGPSGILDLRLSLQSAVEYTTHYLSILPNERHAVPFLYKGPLLGRSTAAPPHSAPHSTKTVLQRTISASREAWLYLNTQAELYGYGGRSTGRGVAHYLAALLAANPNPLTDWEDGRPDSLTQFDAFRLHNNLFPYWARGNYEPRRIPRSINAAQFSLMQPTLLAIANRFIIGPFRGNQLDPDLRAAAVIEAIGLTFLIPHNSPRAHPSPPNPVKRRYRANRASRLAGDDFTF